MDHCLAVVGDEADDGGVPFVGDFSEGGGTRRHEHLPRIQVKSNQVKSNQIKSYSNHIQVSELVYHTIHLCTLTITPPQTLNAVLEA